MEAESRGSVSGQQILEPDLDSTDVTETREERKTRNSD